MAHDFDACVIGSGFGGAPVAARLTEAGYRVVVLERGRRWDPADYPRKPGDAWLWDHKDPARRHGWLDLRAFPRMSVAVGAGVGGGSLIYTSASRDAPPDVFDAGWPPEITFAELRPYYDKVAAMLEPREIPDNQETPRTRILRDAATAAGFADRFGKIPLAIRFDPHYAYDGTTPPRIDDSTRSLNAHGRRQGTCVGLGNCYVGCDVQAKNTLDLNYLARAEDGGAQVRPLHVVRRLTPHDGGYRVDFEIIAGGALQPGSLSARLVVVSAGSLGSTELLLRCRDEFRTLPHVSPRLGHGWSGNGEALTLGLFKRKAYPSRGPTFSALVDFNGPKSLDGQHFMIEDGGFPDLLGNFLREARAAGNGRGAHGLLDALRHVLGTDSALDGVIPYFGQSRDAADGRLRLRRRFLGLIGPRELHLDWDPRASERALEALIRTEEKITRAGGGTHVVLPAWSLFKELITAHPLGGCGLGGSAHDGVVAHTGEVFGHRNLFVSDGAIIPRALGLFPSKTIAALGERIAALIARDGR